MKQLVFNAITGESYEEEYTPPPAPIVPLDVIKAGLKVDIDVAAERERRKYITAGEGQAMTYMQKAAEAAGYLAAVAKNENPDPVDYPLLSAEIGITGATIIEVATVIDGAYRGWQQIGAAIEAMRLGTKAAIEAAETETDAYVASAAVAWP
ncbi:hypothetical protein QTL95_27060 [Rhizobium sp. S152]|uniref:hypothetical protein n=1 Tax=Rhizobium sp. S152 TaxID=3055038 RepID=UPI0025A9C708|nr:hypothetical protein [Rhizobium sp. S152]MDM9629549.1 hypothetical protein [Rhizobium sp. S152]